MGFSLVTIFEIGQYTLQSIGNKMRKTRYCQKDQVQLAKDLELENQKSINASIKDTEGDRKENDMLNILNVSTTIPCPCCHRNSIIQN